MILHIDVNNKSKSPIKKTLICEVVRNIFKEPDFVFLKNKNVSLSIALVNEKEIKELNKKFRKVNKATDVLSFAEYKNSQSLKKDKSKELFLGELVLCYNDIASYAKKKKIKISMELAEVISHGMLHLLGFEHGDKMFKIQKEAAKNF